MTRTSIIVIDDDKDTSDVLCEYLKIKDVLVLGQGYDGREAVKLYKEHNPDIVLLDYDMPKYDGVYAIKNIRKYDPNAKIIVVLTPIPEPDRRLIGLNGVFHTYKPYEIDSLVEKIEEVSMRRGIYEFTKKVSGQHRFDLDDKCPNCNKKGNFECHQLELDDEFGYKITCKKCKSVFHEIYTFNHWEQLK